ncbi:AfsA-related hotdog domain-containing protein [Streptomyces uncialis]|uniref:AfsA-related hotdog domain-containing protein n=1 Tax=Streptomyces uncialis TaxID=1048205 RepID=UPI00382640EE
MTTSCDQTSLLGTPAPGHPCRYDTVPPSLVDRERPENVLFASAVFDGERITAVPRPTAGHLYFGDRPEGQDGVDLRTILEMGRAAAFLAFEAVGDRRAGMCVAIARARLIRPAPSVVPAPRPGEPGGPGGYVMRCARLRDTFWSFAATHSTGSPGAPSAGSCEGRATILDSRRLAALRAEERRLRIAALRAERPDDGPAESATPGEVGRRRPENVFVAGVRHTPDGTRALLRVPAAHPVVHDPAYDHLPALALADAALQLVHARHGGRVEVREIDLRPTRFCETDLPVRLSLGSTGTRPGELRFEAVQGGMTVARAQLVTVGG